MKFSLILSLSLIGAYANTSLANNHNKVLEYQKECKTLHSFLKTRTEYKDMDVKCNYNYSHWNSKSSQYYKGAPKKLKVAGYNLLHPSTDKTKFKDFQITAKMINQWDIMGATELIPLTSRDAKLAANISKLITEIAPNGIAAYELKITAENEKLKKNKASLRTENNKSNSSQTKIDSLNSKIEKSKGLIAGYKIGIKKFKSDVKLTNKIYPEASYLKILRELRKLDKSWALLLSPVGEAERESSQQEFAGVFYRSSVIKPKTNKYCTAIRKVDKASAYACLPTFSSSTERNAFSRRPFLSSFQSGSFKFSMLVAHVIWGEKSLLTKQPRMGQILKPAFGVNNLDEFKTKYGKGTHVTGANFARVAEVKLTVKLMDKLKKNYSVDNIIYYADTNLNLVEVDQTAVNTFGKRKGYWDIVFDQNTGIDAFVTERTTATSQFYKIDKDGNKYETNGLANSYDHFVFNKSEIRECATADDSNIRLYNYHSKKSELVKRRQNWSAEEKKRIVSAGDLVRKKYGVLTGSGASSKFSKTKFDKVLSKIITVPYAKPLNFPILKRVAIDANHPTVKQYSFIEDDKYEAKGKENFIERVLNSQKDLAEFYYKSEQLLSDHLPIEMNCTL